MSTSKAIFSAALLIVGPMACVNRMEPPPALPRVAPEIQNMPEAAPEPGMTRVALDADEKGADVSVVLATTEGTGYVGLHTVGWQAVATRRLCRTPCIVDLPRGDHSLVFASRTDDTRRSVADVTFGSRPEIVRHSIGRVEPHPWLFVGGLTLLPTGLTGVIAGAVAAPSLSDPGDRQLGYIALGAGAGLTALGALLLYLGRTDVQPGSTTQWSSDPPPSREIPMNTSALLSR